MLATKIWIQKTTPNLFWIATTLKKLLWFDQWLEAIKFQKKVRALKNINNVYIISGPEHIDDVLKVFSHDDSKNKIVFFDNKIKKFIKWYFKKTKTVSYNSNAFLQIIILFFFQCKQKANLFFHCAMGIQNVLVSSCFNVATYNQCSSLNEKHMSYDKKHATFELQFYKLLNLHNIAPYKMGSSIKSFYYKDIGIKTYNKIVCRKKEIDFPKNKKNVITKKIQILFDLPKICCEFYKIDIKKSCNNIKQAKILNKKICFLKAHPIWEQSEIGKHLKIKKLDTFIPIQLFCFRNPKIFYFQTSSVKFFKEAFNISKMLVFKCEKAKHAFFNDLKYEKTMYPYTKVINL